MAKKRSSSGPKSAGTTTSSDGAKRTRLSQADVPGYTLDQALEVPRAIADNFASKPTKPLQVARAMGVQPSSGGFRGKCGAAIAYGLTSGGPNASEIAIEPVGMRIVRPLEEDIDLEARREALLRPRVINEFLQKYDGSPLPRADIAHNVLVDMGVPQDKASNVMTLILDSARAVGFLTEIKGKNYVDLENVAATPEDSHLGDPDDDLESEEEAQEESVSNLVDFRREKQHHIERDDVSHEANKKRVFITHGKNQAFIEPIKKLLGFGELEAIVAGQRQSVSQPVPIKVMNDMRGCGAAIIHVDAEQKLIDQDAEEHTVLNPNVLIEIGAAMALYGDRFILLVRDGLKLPSNLQGLYEVRYSGDSLDGNATIKLLEAINDIKNHPLPARYSSEDSPPKG